MPFRLFEPAQAPPDWPHIHAADGYWWHADPDDVACYAGRVAGVGVRELEACFTGPALARAQALAQLSGPQYRRIWPKACSACGGNHRANVQSLRRAWRQIDPELKDRPDVRALSTKHLIALAAVRGVSREHTRAAQRRWLLTRGMQRSKAPAPAPAPMEA